MAKYSKNLDKLFNRISDLEAAIKDGKISIYPFNNNSKKPIYKEDENGVNYAKQYDKQIPLHHFWDNNNIALVPGFDGKGYGKHLGVIDIDGYKKYPNNNSKLWYDSKLHKIVCDDLYEVLKDLPIESIHIRTWSNGYHIYYFTSQSIATKNKKEFVSVLEFIRFPSDYHIKELQNKGINELDDMVEIFSKNNQRTITYPSSIKESRKDSNNKKSIRIGNYKIISDNPSIDSMFENPVDDIESLIVDVFSNNGFSFDEDGYKQAIASKSIKNHKVKTYKNKGKGKIYGNQSSNLYRLTPKIRKGLVTELCSIMDKTIGKHYQVVIALDGGLTNLGLSEDDRKSLLFETFDKVDDNSQHYEQVESSISNPSDEKIGFSTIMTLEPKTKLNIEKIKELIDKSKDKGRKELLEPIKRSIDDLKYSMDSLLSLYDDNTKVQKDIEKMVENLRKTIYPYDLYYELYNKPSKKDLRLKLAIEVSNDFNIKSYYDVNHKEDKIYYLTSDGYYEYLNEYKLRSLIYESRNCNYTISICKDIIEAIPSNSDKKDNLIQFSNVIFDNTDLSYVPIDEFNIKENLVHKKIGVRNDVTGKLTLLTYNPKARLTDNPSERTYVEQTLRKIYIPKNDENNHNFIIDRLQRLGATILGITNKTITYNYDSKGGSGKSTMNFLEKSILNDLYINIGAKAFKQTFTTDLLSYKHSVNIDETTPKELEEILQELKKYSSNNNSINDRRMYSTENVQSTGFGNIEIFSNYLFTPNLDDNGIINRIDIIEYPNLFRKEHELGKYDNAYLEDGRTYDKLLDDIDGLSWLASASINEYMDIYPNGKFKCYQTNEQVLDILGNHDIYSKFCYLYLERDNDKFTTNKEIRIVFKEYAKRTGKLVNDSDDKIGKKLGLTIKSMFGTNVKIRTTIDGKNDTFYNLRIRTFDEVENYSKKKLIAIDDDYLSESDLVNIKLLDSNQKMVYKNIKNQELTSIKELEDNYTGIDVTTIVYDLLELNLIEYKEIYQIDDYR